MKVQKDGQSQVIVINSDRGHRLKKKNSFFFCIYKFNIATKQNEEC